MCRQFGTLPLICAMAFGLATGQQRPQPSAGSAPRSAQAGQEQLTDRDVIQMVESGKPEATIVSTIRSSRTNFDLSPQGVSHPRS